MVAIILTIFFKLQVLQGPTLELTLLSYNNNKNKNSNNNNNNDKNENPHLDFSKRMVLSAQNQSTRAMAKQGVKFIN